jgi:hypothetical protein
MSFNPQEPKNEYQFRLGTEEYVVARVNYHTKSNGEQVAKVTYEIDNARELGFDPKSKTLDVIVTGLFANKTKKKIRRAIATEIGLRRIGVRALYPRLGKLK